MNPVSDAIARREAAGLCPFCGGELVEVKKLGEKPSKVCSNDACGRNRNTGTRYRIRGARRRATNLDHPSGPSGKAAERAARRKELGLGRFDPLP